MPVPNCEECRKFLFDEDGTKLRKRGKGEEPPCDNCANSFDWHPEALAGFRLANQCIDPQTLGFRQLPDSGGIRDQNPRLMCMLEATRGVYRQKRKIEEDKLKAEIESKAKGK